MERKFYMFHPIEWTFFQEQAGGLAVLLQLSLVIYLLLALIFNRSRQFFTPSNNIDFEFYSDQ